MNLKEKSATRSTGKKKGVTPGEPSRKGGRLRDRQVALLIETSNAYARGLLQGVMAYVREHPGWSIYFVEHGRGDAPPSWLEQWNGDGIIARIENEKIAQAVLRSALPAVDLSAARLVPHFPWLETHDAEVSRLAVDHLVGRGFRHFAYCGDHRFKWSGLRAHFFEEWLQQAGYRCHHFRPPHQVVGVLEKEIGELGRWLESLPKPLGVMACYDIRGQQVLDACRNRGLQVPEAVSVIGVDNDELLCGLSSPPLTSVILNPHRTGFEAAQLLDRMMSGERVAPKAHLIEPIGVETRQSTDVLAISDEQIARALRFIREHAAERINVQDVLKVVSMSRRLFERRFKKLVGVTPHEEIVREQVNRVVQLLTTTDFSLVEIADRTGFEHVEYLSVMFKKKMGLSPSQYRSRNRNRKNA